MQQIQKFFLDPAKLNKLAKEHHAQYVNAHPFPHIVIDNLFLPDTLDIILDEFPRPEQIEWKKYENPAERKLASKTETQIGDYTRFFLYQLNSSVFISFLEVLTGIKGIIPDPHFWGGGLHQIKRGGLLKVHADFNRYERLRLDRRLNLLIYLNKDWQEEYGGYLELWDKDMSNCETRILPIFNRCVIFNTTDFSYHGHPDPLSCPEDWTRKSIALYYYTNGRPQEEVSSKHTTLFRHRPGELFERPEDRRTLLRTVKPILKKCIPPIIFDLKDHFPKWRH